MAPAASTQTLLSPAELSYIHASLLQNPPIRPDLRAATQFRPLVSETDILPTTSGSARVCYSDGTEAIVGVKAELERTVVYKPWHEGNIKPQSGNNGDDDVEMDDSSSDGDIDEQKDATSKQAKSQREKADLVGHGNNSWFELSIEIPGFRDDDSLPVFLSSMLSETLSVSSTLLSSLRINERWHWKLYIDILLMSPPLSYPLPLLSLTTHLALLDTRLPRRISEPADDPLFDDDWDAAIKLYTDKTGVPPVTLLVMTVGGNIIFDPSKEELAVAECVLALSFAPAAPAAGAGAPLKILAVRTIDPPSRTTPPGLSDSENPAIVGTLTEKQPTTGKGATGTIKEEAWSPPKGGIKRMLFRQIVKMVVEAGGVGEEILDGLKAYTKKNAAGG